MNKKCTNPSAYHQLIVPSESCYFHKHVVFKHSFMLFRSSIIIVTVSICDDLKQLAKTPILRSMLTHIYDIMWHWVHRRCSYSNPNNIHSVIYKCTMAINCNGYKKKTFVPPFKKCYALFYKHPHILSHASTECALLTENIWMLMALVEFITQMLSFVNLSANQTLQTTG